jgi:uncharacterized protein (TIGR03437 family)
VVREIRNQYVGIRGADDRFPSSATEKILVPAIFAAYIQNCDMNRLASLLLILPIAHAWQAAAQTWDTSGNSLLNGTYYFRNVGWQVGDAAGNLSAAEAIYGNITFDGNGNYTINDAQIAQPGSNGNVTTQTFGPVTGTYSIAASGYGFLTSPINSGDLVYGLVSQGIFIGSATENPGSTTTHPYNDLFIAAQLAQPQPTNAFFHGTYTLSDVDSPNGSPQATSDTILNLTADGTGRIGTVEANGYIAQNGGSLLTQSISGVKYLFSNGAANVSFGSCSSASLFCGTRYLYFSADGNFVFGGAPDSWDMLVGVRNVSGAPAPNFSGLYYQASLGQDLAGLNSGAGVDTISYFGSAYAIPNSGTTTAGQILAHQRVLSVPQSTAAIDYSYADPYSFQADGTYTDANYRFYFGGGGAVRIGIGDPGISGGTVLGINVALRSPTFSGPGVYINPTGIQNAGSSALFTAGLAPGEFISIYGTNLAPRAEADSTSPFTLDGVQVSINGRPAPIYFVSPGQIDALVPYGTVETVASIQVINNRVASNTVTAFVNHTAPGVLTNPAGGLGHALAEHADGTLVTPDNPAGIGETLQLFVVGLGNVTPALPDGVPSYGSPPNLASNSIAVTVGNVLASVSFAGLASGYAGLYQISFQVPNGVASGDVYLDVSGPDYYTSEALLPIASSTGARSAQPAVRRQRPAIGKVDSKLRHRP